MGLAPCFVKVHLAAISAFHNFVDGKHCSRSPPHTSKFLTGLYNFYPSKVAPVPQWRLSQLMLITL